MIKCTLHELEEPSEIIKSPWIRPEDISEYFNLGINFIKISSRRMPADWILRCANAYISGHYDGNLFDLIGRPIHRFTAYDPLFDSIEGLPPIEIVIDNNTLDGFIDFFKKGKIRCSEGCENCNYCQDIAEKSLKMDYALAKEYKQYFNLLISKLTNSDFLDESYDRMKKIWDESIK